MGAFEQPAQFTVAGLPEKPDVVAGAPEEKPKRAADYGVPAQYGDGGRGLRRTTASPRGEFPGDPRGVSWFLGGRIHDEAMIVPRGRIVHTPCGVFFGFRFSGVWDQRSPLCGEIKPRSMARTTAWVRSETPSLRMMRST